MSNHWVFLGPKRDLHCQYLKSEEALDTAVLVYFDSIEKETCVEAFEMQKKRMKRCIQVQGDYNQKL